MSAKSGLTSPLGTIVYIDSAVVGVCPNFIEDGGASNALTATLQTIDGSSVTLQAGLRLLLKSANTLQAGANTLALNGGSTKSIKNINGNNIKTTTAAGAMLDMVYDGTNWVLLNSTY